MRVPPNAGEQRDDDCPGSDRNAGNAVGRCREGAVAVPAVAQAQLRGRRAGYDRPPTRAFRRVRVRPPGVRARRLSAAGDPKPRLARRAAVRTGRPEEHPSEIPYTRAHSYATI